LLLSLLPSCTSVYIPTNTVPIGFEASQDISVAATVGTNGIHGNAAYTPLKHVYLQGPITYVGETQRDHHHFGYQYGLGTYWGFPSIPLNTKSNS
jgi:hypothetical protein